MNLTNINIIPNKHNYCIDFIKGIACFFVVFMHCEFPGRFGTVVQAVSRFCVPFFFMVSGYFSYSEGEFKARKKIGHIVKLTLLASIFYLLVAISDHFGFGRRLSFSAKDVLDWLLFNKPFIISGHLWFLFALLYDYVLYAFVVRYHLHRTSYWLIPVLLATYIILAQGAHLYEVKIPNMYYRNFLIEGFPLFMLGNFLRRYEARVKIIFNDKILCVVLVLSTVACLAERCLLGRDFGINVFTLPQLVSIFILAMRHETEFEKHPLRYIGAKLSMYVYIIHIFIWKNLVEHCYGFFHISRNRAAMYSKPIIVLVLTLLISFVIVLLNDHIRRKSNDLERKNG